MIALSARVVTSFPESTIHSEPRKLILRCPNRYRFKIQPASDLKSQRFRIIAISVSISVLFFHRGDFGCDFVGALRFEIAAIPMCDLVKGPLRSGLVRPDVRPDLSFPFCSGILPICPRIFRICPFHLSWPVRSTHEDQSRKGPRHTQDLSPQKWEPLMKEIPESEIQAKFFADTGEKRSEILAKHFADSRPLISRKSGRMKFHKKPSTFSTRGRNRILSQRDSGSGGSPRTPPVWKTPVLPSLNLGI